MFVLFYDFPKGGVWWTPLPHPNDSDVPRLDRNRFHGECPEHLLTFPAHYGRGKERGKCKIMRAVRALLFYPKRCMPAVFPMGELHVDLRGSNPSSSRYRGVCIIGSGRQLENHF